MIKEIDIKEIDKYKDKLDCFSLNVFDLFDNKITRKNTYIVRIGKNRNESVVVTYHIRETLCWLGVYLINISAKQLRELVRYIWKKHINVTQIYIKHSVAQMNGLTEMNHWKIVLPQNDRELHDRLTKKAAYNLRREKCLLEKNIGEISIANYKPYDCPVQYIDSFFRWKKEQMNTDYNMSAIEYMESHFVTDVYCLLASNILVAIVFTCEQGEKVYLENLSYDSRYSRYSPGALLYDGVLCSLIKKEKRMIYLGDGKQFYKTRYGSLEEKPTYSGIYFRKSLKEKICNKFSGIISTFNKNKLFEFTPSQNDKLLIVAPHPDDETIGCGQLIRQYGNQITVLLMTNGNIGIPGLSKETTMMRRYSEFDRAMSSVKIFKSVKLGLNDSTLKIINLYQVIKSVDLKEYRYIFVPNKDDNHPDHRITNRIFKALCIWKNFKGNLMEYEIWTPLQHYNCYIPYNEFNEKKQLMEYYKSQLEVVDYKRMVEGLNQYRGAVIGSRYAECYNIKFRFIDRVACTIGYIIRGGK